MKNDAIWKELIKAVKAEVLPALGCTEPISLALASAIAADKLGDQAITKIEAKVSPNLMKNGMGVTVPGTGTVGLHIAAAVGAIAGDPNAGLEVLKKITDQHVHDGKKLLSENKVSVDIAETTKPLYSEANVYSERDHVRVCIADGHTNVILIEKNGEQLFAAQQATSNHKGNTDIMKQMSVKQIYDFIEAVPFDDIAFILQAQELNNALSQEGLKNEYGLRIGSVLQEQIKNGLLADDLLSKVMIRTTAASDARMGGATLPAMSNSGSGNQGIAATMPVVVVADFIEASEDKRARAMMLSHTLAIYIHSKFPALSALCAVSTAAMGSAAGMAYLLSNGKYETIEMTLCNMVGDLTGIICDGASNSCAMKVSTSVSSGFKAVLMALSQVRVTGNEGIVADCVEASINNLCALASKSMKHTDVQIIEIMAHKAS